MTYKFYDENGNSLELIKNYQDETIVIELDGESHQSIHLTKNDVEDLIFVLNKLTNK